MHVLFQPNHASAVMRPEATKILGLLALERFVPAFHDVLQVRVGWEFFFVVAVGFLEEMGALTM